MIVNATTVVVASVATAKAAVSVATVKAVASVVIVVRVVRATTKQHRLRSKNNG